MAIHPRYADAILDGTKTVEFRKRRLADDITTVVIYATSPVQRIVGQFNVVTTVVDSPSSIWSVYGPVGVIDENDFFDYYGENERAVAIVVGEPQRYASAKQLAELEPAPAIPQSFSYLGTGVVA